MEQVQHFNFNGNTFNVVLINNEPHWIAKEVCEFLEISNTTQAIASLKDQTQKKKVDAQTCTMLNIGHYPDGINLLSEAGLYKLVFKSRKQEAETFSDWVASDVLPSIRKHGAFLTDQKIEEVLSNPDTIIRLATELKAERQKAKALQAENAKLQIKSDFVDKVMDNDQKIDIGQAAKILELPFGRNTLFQQLRLKGVFFKNRNEPKQDFVDKGFFQLKEKWIDRTNHEGFLTIKVLVTQRGLAFLAKLFEVEAKSKQLAKLN
jgi:prophage antirepressor-like protein